MNFRTSMTCSIAAAALLTSATAFAQNGFQVEQFEPQHAQGINILGVASSQPLRHLTPSVGLFFHLQDDPYQVETTGGEIRARLIDEQLKAELNAGLGLFGLFDLGLALPLVLAQSGEGSADASVGAFSGFAIADMRVTPKFRLLDSARTGGLGVALLAPIWLPIGDQDTYNSDGALRVEPRVAADWTSDVITVALNVGVQIRPQREVLNYTSGTALRYGLGAEAPIFDPLSVIASYQGSVGLSQGRNPRDLGEAAANSKARPMELLGGLQVALPASLVAQAGAGIGLTSSVGSPDFRVFASIGYTPRGADSDGDGIPDSADECPNEPEDRDGFQDRDGCPDPDNDGDGILDRDDRCPDEPGVPENQGCPEGPKDSDGDGILDSEDKCPNEPEDKDGFEDEDGCPDPDNDGDGIPDEQDQCPNEPETINGVEDEDGCPDEGASKVRVTESKIEILDRVYFDTNKDTIQARSYDVLNQVASVLKAYRQITSVRIEGHTDSQGDDAYNLDLSQRRADAVKRYLEERGVDGSRLESKGFGEINPIATNDTSEGRSQNRRVEFVIVEVDGKAVEGGAATIQTTN